MGNTQTPGSAQTREQQVLHNPPQATVSYQQNSQNPVVMGNNQTPGPVQPREPKILHRLLQQLLLGEQKDKTTTVNLLKQQFSLSQFNSKRKYNCRKEGY